MISSMSEEIALALSIPLLVAVTNVLIVVRRRLLLYAKSRCVARVTSMIVAKEEPSDEDIRALRMRFSERTILDSVTFISEYIYGVALNRLSLIIEVCRVPYSPISSNRLNEVATLIALYPDYAIRHIARFDMPLFWCDVALLAQLMRRAGTSIAYTPLLISQNRNLQLIGLYFCGHFSIVDSEPYLQQLIGSEDNEIAYISLLSLCAIHGDISTPQVSRALNRLLPHQRASFLRYATQACYSLRSCAHLISREEYKLFAQRINSYKCQIVCN